MHSLSHGRGEAIVSESQNLQPGQGGEDRNIFGELTPKRQFFEFPEDGPPAGDSSDPGSGRSHKLHVLIVEDNEVVSEVLCDLFSSHDGFEVRVATTGDEALHLAGQFQPNLILMDIKLGEEDGRDVCRAIKQALKAPTKVIAMSGYVPMDDIPSLATDGFDHYLHKPFRMEDVLRVIDKLTGMRKSA